MTYPWAGARSRTSTATARSKSAARGRNRLWVRSVSNAASARKVAILVATSLKKIATFGKTRSKPLTFRGKCALLQSWSRWVPWRHPRHHVGPPSQRKLTKKDLACENIWLDNWFQKLTKTSFYVNLDDFANIAEQIIEIVSTCPSRQISDKNRVAVFWHFLKISKLFFFLNSLFFSFAFSLTWVCVCMLFTLDWATIDGAVDTPKTTITRNNFGKSFEKESFQRSNERDGFIPKAFRNVESVNFTL